tara:strand:+ start:137 stop:841 length:705 start_codon:yes stop_codon:yes gene_type:complete
MAQNLQQNRKLVQGVFNKVFDKYDFMNDVMSLGIHRSWKKQLIQMMNPSESQSLIDVASGTGDIAKLYSISTKNCSKILCTDSNSKMINQGKKKLHHFNNINWKVCPAENLLAPSNHFDFYTISFGLRNTKNINKSISEAYRVLKKGGRFLCLEFSKVQNPNLEAIYNNYSKLIPIIGKIVVGDDKPYKYLVKSINNFVDQENLINIMEKNKFLNCSYKNLNGGIVAIHSGWKV